MYNIFLRETDRKRECMVCERFSLTLQDNKKNILYTGEWVDNMISL